MLSLSSSAENRINTCKQSLVIALVGKKGRFWDAVCDIRRQWGIHATTSLPPSLHPWRVHMPPGEPKYADFEEDGHEEWASFHDRWRQQLAELHDRFVPEDCRIGGRYTSRLAWERFLSACVLYDPPDKQLEEYANRHNFGQLGHYQPPRGNSGSRVSPYGMISPPIRWMRDGSDTEAVWMEVFNRFVARIIEHHEKVPNMDIENLVREAMRSPDFLAPVREDAKKNPSRPFIEVQPWHTEDDIRNAFRMIRGAQKEGLPRGRPRRDQLIAVQCAILADRYGENENQIGGRYGWTDYSRIARYIREGRQILSQL